MKRILLTIPAITSCHILLSDLMEELVKQGWDVHLGSSLAPIQGFDCYGRLAPGITAHHVPFARGANPWQHWQAARSLDGLVLRTCPDIIHCHFSAAAFTAALARTRSWGPTIATVQGLVFPASSGWRKWVFGAAEYIVQSKMDGLWVLTQSDVDAFAALGVKHDIHLHRSFGFGCRLDTFSPDNHDEASRREGRSALGIGANDFVFAFVGRQVDFKGFHHVVRAFLRINQRHPSTKLLLIGDRDPIHPTGLCPHEEIELRSSSAILFTGWTKEVAKHLALAQVNVFPSRREGMPINLMESLAMGVPVITVDSRGCRDVVQHGVNGLVLPIGNERLLEMAMEQLLLNGALRSELSRNAIAGRSRFDRRIWIDEQVSIYENLLVEGR